MGPRVDGFGDAAIYGAPNEQRACANAFTATTQSSATPTASVITAKPIRATLRATITFHAPLAAAAAALAAAAAALAAAAAALTAATTASTAARLSGGRHRVCHSQPRDVHS